MCAIDVCIPKMEATVSEYKIRKGIENTKIGKVLRYTEIPWRYDSEIKRVLMNIEWNPAHEHYSLLKSRLENGENIKIVMDTLIWHVYKKGTDAGRKCWERGTKTISYSSS